MGTPALIIISVLGVLIGCLGIYLSRRELGLRHTLEAEIEVRKKIEEDLRQKTIDLEHSNKELDQFAFVASHDLQEPLRKIIAFGDRLKDSVGNQFDEKAKAYLDRMQAASRRMKQLIEDLLRFSRVSTSQGALTCVNLEKVVRVVLSDLEVRISQSGGQVEMENLPVVWADELQMRQLFQNLITNALKFTKSGDIASVVLKSQMLDSGQMAEITVEDHGIGFDEKYLSHIFEPFQRLHSWDEYEGTGMGLAISQRIVKRHGGTLTAKSKPGEGSIFIVRLPLAGSNTVSPDERH